MQIRLVLLGGVYLRMMLHELATHLTLLEGDWALGTGYHHWSTALCASKAIVAIIAVLRTGTALSVMYPILIHWALCSRVHSQLGWMRNWRLLVGGHGCVMQTRRWHDRRW